MNFEDFEVRSRAALQSGAETEALRTEFARLDNEARVAAWTFLTRLGISDVDFCKFVHRNFAVFVLEVFGMPVQVDKQEKKVT